MLFVLCVLQDALTLQRVCLSTKAELVSENDNSVPDVPALVQQLMLNVFVSTLSHAVNSSCCMYTMLFCTTNSRLHSISVCCSVTCCICFTREHLQCSAAVSADN